MRALVRRSLAASVAGAALLAGPAVAAGAQGLPSDGPHHGGPGQAQTVFVQTDDPSGNAIVVLAARADGRLSERSVVATGGLGGRAQGAVVDPLASQGSLVYDPGHHLLLAVNAGSGTLSALAFNDAQLRLRQVVSTAGSFPDSIAVHGDLVYVLDAGGPGTVTGYRISGQRLVPLAGSSRSLGLTNTTPPNFLTGPGQIGFSRDGAELVVTTKASTSSLDVFGVGADGRLTSAPTVTTDPGNVPFAFTFGRRGALIVAEAGGSTVHTYSIGAGGSLVSTSPPVPDGQAALCWITPASGYDYVANAGSNDLSAYTVSAGGTPSLIGTSGVVATTDAGPIDMASSADGRTLYVEAGGAGAVDEFGVNGDGSLTDLGSVAGLGTGIEGIAAT